MIKLNPPHNLELPGHHRRTAAPEGWERGLKDKQSCLSEAAFIAFNSGWYRAAVTLTPPLIFVSTHCQQGGINP
jgi:hypothetical protein